MGHKCPWEMGVYQTQDDAPNVGGSGPSYVTDKKKMRKKILKVKNWGSITVLQWDICALEHLKTLSFVHWYRWKCLYCWGSQGGIYQKVGRSLVCAFPALPWRCVQGLWVTASRTLFSLAPTASLHCWLGSAGIGMDLECFGYALWIPDSTPVLVSVWASLLWKSKMIQILKQCEHPHEASKGKFHTMRLFHARNF